MSGVTWGVPAEPVSVADRPTRPTPSAARDIVVAVLVWAVIGLGLAGSWFVGAARQHTARVDACTAGSSTACVLIHTQP